MKDISPEIRVFEPSNDWLTSAEAAELLGLTPDTLRSYRTRGRRRGPPFQKLGHFVVYRRADVDAFLAKGGEDV